jgi:hypothetical protein
LKERRRSRREPPGAAGRLRDFKEAAFKPEVHDLILKENAIAALNLA